MARGAAYRLYVWLMVFSGLVLALTLGATSVKIILAGRHFTQTILEENKGFLANSLRFTHETMMRTEKEAYDLLIQRALKSTFIRYLAFLDSQGQVLAESDPLEEFPSIVAHHFPELEEGKLVEQVGDTILICYRAAEVLPPAEETDRPQHRGGGSRAGMRLPDKPEWFLVALDISSFQSHYREMVVQTTGVALALLLFGVLVILFFGIVQRYELAHLSIEKLRRIKRLLGHFVPDFAKRMIEKDPEKKGLLDKYVQDATILFLDVEGFTTLLQQYPQERINRTIEGYFSAYLDVIRKNGGDINETAGDGMMVIFLDPDPARHAARAVQAAGEIRLKTENSVKGGPRGRECPDPDPGEHGHPVRPGVSGLHQDEGPGRRALDVHRLGRGDHRGGPVGRPCHRRPDPARTGNSQAHRRLGAADSDGQNPAQESAISRGSSRSTAERRAVVPHGDRLFALMFLPECC